MKELSIEEKAHRYDEALERARLINNKGTWVRCDSTEPSICEQIFPELAESENERIRKEIIEYMKNKSTIPVNKCNRWTTWLEKQGEQISDPRYSILDKLIEADDIYQMSVNDAMVEEAKNKTIEALSKLEISKLLGLEKQNGQKPAWSEDDEDYINDLIKYFSQNERLKNTEKDIVIWLKSLKDRYTWKPSEDQMKALEHFTRSVGESGYASPYDNNTKLLYSLLEQLKKLKE